jgi:hypothetical protein
LFLGGVTLRKLIEENFRQFLESFANSAQNIMKGKVVDLIFLLLIPNFRLTIL